MTRAKITELPAASPEPPASKARVFCVQERARLSHALRQLEAQEGQLLAQLQEVRRQRAELDARLKQAAEAIEEPPVNRPPTTEN